MPDIIETFTKAMEAGRKLKDADLNLALADLKMEIVDLKEENTGLRGELASMRESEIVRTKLEVREGLYYLKEEHQNLPDGPYCTRCFDVEAQLVLVTVLPLVMKELGKHRCPNCKAIY